MDYVSTLLIHTYDWLWVMTLALVAERLMPIPQAYHPNQLIKGLSHALQQKVLKPNRTASQQAVAGLLATLIMVLFAIPVPLFALAASPFPWLVEFVLLTLCLQWRPMARQLNRFANTPATQKQLRRTLLNSWLARDCDTLSELGSNKAAIEAIYLRSFHDQFAPLFWYAVGGIWWVLGYYLMLQLSRQWHPLLRQQVHFGKQLKTIRAVFDVIPQLTWATWLALSTTHRKAGLKLSLARQFRSKARGFTLAAAQHRLGCDIGGPALYDGRKYQRPRFDNQRPPTAVDIKLALQQVNWHLTLLLSLIWTGIVSHTFWIVFAG
ncbi:adenosylcobinamide-phosphate synthase [Neiella marina]|uniref:Adenosylcobinamide-phosphate synthase n=1 Tax=Neiella marina TaxID=508461 RepID=A0A8J2XPF3_9GAMM|nr:cobalamin biosynthesis protein [Neiella marina]GGA87818.1 adenosylcobinamide-phosphate synthase [Neiella marina]